MFLFFNKLVLKQCCSPALLLTTSFVSNSAAGRHFTRAKNLAREKSAAEREAAARATTDAHIHALAAALRHVDSNENETVIPSKNMSKCLHANHDSLI